MVLQPVDTPPPQVQGCCCCCCSCFQAGHGLPPEGNVFLDLISTAHHRTFSYEVEMVILYGSRHSFSLERRFVGIGLNVGNVKHWVCARNMEG